MWYARLRVFFHIEHGFMYFSWNQLIKKISKKKFVKLTLIFDDANNLTKKYTWHSVCEMKNSISPKIFRQINSFVISLVKTLVSRNVCQKSVRVWNSNNHHNVPEFFGFFDKSLCLWGSTYKFISTPRCVRYEFFVLQEV